MLKVKQALFWVLGRGIMADVFYYGCVTISPWTYFLAMSDQGLAYVGMKGDEQALIFSYYPNRLLIHDPKRLAPYTKQLKEYFNGNRHQFDVEIDISEFGTPFQRSVLQLVQKVPYGTTVSYSDIASALDSARSVRAVAHAIALNPVLFFIPCHRIIMANGMIGGYRLGSKEKSRLINLEKSHLHDNL